MDAPQDSPVTDDELHALLDGRLKPEERAALQARLAQDPTAHARWMAWQRQHAALRGLHAELLRQDLPMALQGTAHRAQHAQLRVRQVRQWSGVAASLVLAFGLGWFGRALWMPSSSAVLARQAPARDFVRQAAVAHAVYSPEQRHPVEVGAGQEEHLVQWLSKRLGHPLKLPQLHAWGYDLVGGRLLPGDDGARAQFMYQNAAGERVTLYLGQRPAALAGDAQVEFRYSTDGPVPSFYWMDGEQAYALSGPLSREPLLRLAQAVYQQL
ncbi:anti-sigma factor [Hylemonella gracilis]|jgi:anti-sigma factor RsiW|uniref:Anti-sigma factor n=1 Tax=Hylemonella gracilis TaxID=80880 RepID=A0A4P6UJV9_9BURK|nr:anti-sigma factor [Hylemonella gracilis]QBK05442.1 anti-sigma factor [Hylemonella gracilis]